MAMPDPFTLKHRPVVLIPYDRYDGPYAGDTDCLYLSVGWAQYDPRAVSVKSLRHTGPNEPAGRWSRQSEELPVHRAIDLTLLAAIALQATAEGEAEVSPGTFENQPEPIRVRPRFTSESERRVFLSLLGDEMNKRRLSVLRQTLNGLADAGVL